MTLAVASCLLVTYQLAFQHRAHLFGTLVVYLIDAFFLADIAVNFRTSYRQHGLDITDEDRISRRYRRSVFAFDALAEVPWDAALLPWAGAELGGVSIVLWARLLRMLRVMRLFVILLGASIWAFFIGNIASLLSNLDSTKSLFWGRVESVMQFLRSRQVPQDVREDVQDNYEYIWGRYRGTSGQSLLADLPAPLRLEVLTHLACEVLERVPLFRHCSPVFRNELLMALEQLIVTPGGLIVREGEVANGTYFISRGTVEVLSDGETTPHGTLEDGDYFGDLSLLLGERRTASARALTYCDVFVLPKRELERIKRDYEEFRDALKSLSSERSEEISDLVLSGAVL
jgi:voltage-gated potassium channel